MNTFLNQHNEERNNPGNSNEDRNDKRSERDEGATPERGETPPQERGDYEDIAGDVEE